MLTLYQLVVVYNYMKHNNYVKLLMAIAIIASLSTVPAIALAHEFSSDGSISVTMHVEPNDAPTVGTPETLEFFLADTAAKFNLADCACSYTISGNGKVTSPKDIIFENNLLCTATTMFDHDGQYAITLHGTTTRAGEFEPLTVSLPVTVVRAPNTDKASGSVLPTNWIVGGFEAIGIVLVGVVGGYLLDGYRRAKS